MSGTSADRGPISRRIDALGELLAGWPFAAASLGALLAGGAAMLAMLAWPEGDGAMSAFAGEFRRWCFGRESSGLDPGALVVAASSPIVLALLIAAIWKAPLRAAMRTAPRRVVATTLVTATIVLATGAALFATQRPAPLASDAERLPFPGRSIRTAIPAPAFALVDQRGESVTMDSLRGRVVVVTAIYARCSTACPMILAETRSLVDSLSDADRSRVTLLGVTLDPEHDTQERRAEIARGYGLDGDLRLLGGEPADVERTLDRLGFERRRDPTTGVIDHAKMFVLIDREGRIAYRLAAASSQPRWLPEAVHELVAEPPRQS